MISPEQGLPAGEFHATYPGGEFDGQPHNVRFFERPQQEFLGTDVTEPMTLGVENAAPLQEQDLVDRYVSRLLSC